MEVALSKYTNFIEFIKSRIDVSPMYLNAPFSLFISHVRDHNDKESSELIKVVADKLSIDLMKHSAADVERLSKYVTYFQEISRHC